MAYDQIAANIVAEIRALKEENEMLRADAERWRWLAENCDGDAQDDFTRWLAGTVASKADIDAKIDEAMTYKVPNVKCPS